MVDEVFVDREGAPPPCEAKRGSGCGLWTKMKEGIYERTMEKNV